MYSLMKSNLRFPDRVRRGRQWVGSIVNPWRDYSLASTCLDMNLHTHTQRRTHIYLKGGIKCEMSWSILATPMTISKDNQFQVTSSNNLAMESHTHTCAWVQTHNILFIFLWRHLQSYYIAQSHNLSVPNNPQPNSNPNCNALSEPIKSQFKVVGTSQCLHFAIMSSHSQYNAYGHTHKHVNSCSSSLRCHKLKRETDDNVLLCIMQLSLVVHPRVQGKIWGLLGQRRIKLRLSGPSLALGLINSS